MSHVIVGTKNHVTDADLPLAERVFREYFGMELCFGVKRHNWYERWMNDYHGENAAYHHGIKPEEYGHCEHMVRRLDAPNAYQIGLVRREEGGYWLVWDNYDSGCEITARLGEDAGLFYQRLGAEKVKAAHPQYTFQESFDQEGNLILEAAQAYKF